MNLQPSGYESDAPGFIGFLDPPWSRQIGLFSTIVTVDACSRCRHGADPVTGLVTFRPSETPPKHPTKTPHQKGPPPRSGDIHRIRRGIERPTQCEYGYPWAGLSIRCIYRQGSFLAMPLPRLPTTGLTEPPHRVLKVQRDYVSVPQRHGRTASEWPCLPRIYSHRLPKQRGA